jgi:hypothetical protein
MAGRARHLPRQLHRRLTYAIAHQPCWFTADELLARLGPTVQRFRRREVASFLMRLAHMRLLQTDGTSPRQFRRCADGDWLERCLNHLDNDEPGTDWKVPS